MPKKVLKLRPRQYWRIGEHEAWFADMAAKGLHLSKMGAFAHFIKGEPKKIKYRIDVSTSKKIPQDQIELYEEKGWNYVTSYYLFHVFSSPVEFNAPELYSNLTVQSQTLDELDKKLTTNAIISSATMLIMICTLFAVWFLDGTPTLALVKGLAIYQTALTTFFGYMNFTSLQAAFAIRALRKGLNEGKPINHQVKWKKSFPLNKTISFCFTVVFLLCASIPFIQLGKNDTQTLPESNVDLPIVRLADIENNPAFTRGESYIIDNIDWGNRYTFNWSPLAPIQYETNENGIVPGERWDKWGGEYSPDIHTMVYKLSVPAKAKNLIDDLIKRYGYEENSEDFIEMNHPQLDNLIVYEKETLKEVFASHNNAVMFVRYNGNADIDSLIDNIVEKIYLLSE
ncbi:DUF2812 domain-containing protein [Lysinibacillus mangiferihumi]|uniref:DUF2812 domain-containing protein n=1 Tax=Lysinibacillus mangiferihumi TaxID=1130819 RepID=A0A4U2YYC8_9BACI|nr:DUF2812 domain-containing protein [Lysinibacillus mangiferihumi]TKI66284.1 DUF2812 domain-containing protein [Lysinibacillus mangiferihumi]